LKEGRHMKPLQRNSIPPSRLLARKKFRALTFTALVIALSAGAPLGWAAPTGTTTTLAIFPVSGTPRTVVLGTVITLSATVKAGSAPVTLGQVNFCDVVFPHCTDMGLLGTARLTPSGEANLRLRLGLGSHTIRADFEGTKQNAFSSSADQAALVTGFQPILTSVITDAGEPGNYSLGASFTSGGVSPPTGTVLFQDTSNGNHVLGSGLLQADYSTIRHLQSFETVTSSSWGTAGDFNGDGVLDFAIASYGTNTVSVFLGNGDGSFQAKPSSVTSTGVDPSSIAMGDFRGAGILDLAVTNSGAGTVSLLLGEGNGRFQTQKTFPTGGYPSAVAVGDFNGDGYLDMVVANFGDNTVSVLLGNGDGTFQEQKIYATGNSPSSIAIGDLRGSGKLDLVVANNGDSSVSVLLGNGDGTFQDQDTFATGSLPSSVALGDFRGNGILDLVVGSETLGVLLGNGDGTFQTQRVLGMSVSPAFVALGDLNADRKLDLVAASGKGYVVWDGNGDGTFSYQAGDGSGAAIGVSVGSFIADGESDFAIFQNGEANVNVIGWSLGTPNLFDVSVSGPPPTHAVRAVYNGDSNFSPSTSGLVNLTSTNQTAATPSFATPPGTYSCSAQVKLTDATVDASLYYTTDGTQPTSSFSTRYKSAIMVPATSTIQAIAVAQGYSDSAIATGRFTISPCPAATPVFKPAPGPYSTPQSVTISDSTPGATIYYTTKGSTPTANSTKYVGAIQVSANETIEAIAVAPNFVQSATGTAVYTITTTKAATPSVTQTITIVEATEGATVYYTTDESTPTNKSIKYTGPITLTSGSVLKFIAIAPNLSPSAVRTITTTIQ
jgi:hypothetical protein